MPDPTPTCVNPDCGQMLSIEDDEWHRSPMGECVIDVTCPDCEKKQRVEMFVEKSYMSFDLDVVEAEEEGELKAE